MVWRQPCKTSAAGMPADQQRIFNRRCRRCPQIKTPASALSAVKRLSPAETPRRREEMILPRIALLLASGYKISANL